MQHPVFLAHGLEEYDIDYGLANDPFAATLGTSETNVLLVMILLVLTSILVLILFGVIYALISFFISRIFNKVGIESWRAWIPVYRFWVLLRMGKQDGLWAVLCLIPPLGILALIFILIAMHSIGKSFGKKDTFVLWGVFAFPVWFAILALDSSTWHGKKPTLPS